MPYYELYYHVVWATKNREPLLTADVEPIIYQYLQYKAYNLEAVIHALNGGQDHVHMVATIPPKIAVAKFVGQVKGVASTKYNQRFPDKPAFFWQTDYAAFSFDKKRLPYVIAMWSGKRSIMRTERCFLFWRRQKVMSHGRCFVRMLILICMTMIVGCKR